MLKKLKNIFKYLGPGFITGASDDDPSGIATYSQTGAKFGYNLLWTSLFSLPFMVVIQEMCGRIGIVTGKGLTTLIKRHYPKPILYFAVTLLLIANTINIGADLGAMAAALGLLVDIPFTVLLIVMTVLTLILEIFVSYKVYSRFLKYLTFSLLAYIVTVFVVKQDWSTVAYSTFIPTFSFSHAYILNIVAILGTTISPYMYFWQTSEEVEEELEDGRLKEMDKGKPKFTVLDIKKMRIDTAIGMVFSNLVMFFIIVTAASTLGAHGITNIETADQAAQALRPLAGDLAFALFTIGIVGTGLLAIPILAGSASYAISETLNWNAGLGKQLKQAHGFYGVITIATLIGLLINFTPIKPFQMLYYTAIINGICAPPLLALIILISSNRKIMGKHTNSQLSKTLGWVICIIMTLAAIALIFNF